MKTSKQIAEEVYNISFCSSGSFDLGFDSLSKVT